MKVIKASIEILTLLDNTLLETIERAGRTCYRSEDKITSGSAETFVRMLIARGHEAMLEHASVSIQIQCDRGVTHEIVRHRIASYAQESTRYCNYSKDKFGSEIMYIDPLGGLLHDNREYTQEQLSTIMSTWAEACCDAEKHYMKLIELGASAQMARSVLNNSTKTQIVVTMNLREWRHFLKLRTSEAAHPQMREISWEILNVFRERLSVIVEDIQ